MKTLPVLGNTAKKCKQILLPKQGDKMQTLPVFRNPARKCKALTVIRNTAIKFNFSAYQNHSLEMKTHPLSLKAIKCKPFRLKKHRDKMKNFPIIRNPARKCKAFPVIRNTARKCKPFPKSEIPLGNANQFC